MRENKKIIDGIMRDCGMPVWGTASFGAVREKLIKCGSIRRLPGGAKTVVTAVFPYYQGAEKGEISRYAMITDYHIVAGNMLKSAAQKLSEAFAGYRFEPFCDASPIPEVMAASLAGLGCVGCNGLLITPLYGSYVFIGEIVTDFELDVCDAPKKDCLLCGRCVTCCPSGALTAAGVNTARCVSDISQKKGTLSCDEERLLQKAGTIWGCDICQESCPMNKNIKKTYIEKFQENIVGTLSLEEVDAEGFKEKYCDRAFMWRPKRVLHRNIGILHGTSDNNIPVAQKQSGR